MPSFSFLQISDIHLDSSTESSRLSLPPEKTRRRAAELRALLPAACALVKDRRLQGMLIPGDLFDEEAVRQDTVNFAIEHLASVAPSVVVIAPGNHDFYSPGSPYNDDLLRARKQQPWPENVHIFRSGSWHTHQFPDLPSVRFTGMAHAANAMVHERLLARPIPRPGLPHGAGPVLDLLLLHGSRDNTTIPERKLRTLPFSDAELAAQGFDYAAIGHYHEQASILSPDGRLVGAYAGCPGGRGLDEHGEKWVLIGEMIKDAGGSRVTLERVRLDHRVIHCVEVACTVTAITHREALLRRIEEAVDAREATEDDMVHVRLSGSAAAGIDARIPAGFLGDRFFHISFDVTGLRPGYDLQQYRDTRLRTTEARFARELLGRIETESDPARRRLLENALYYGLDALVQGSVEPRYED